MNGNSDPVSGVVELREDVPLKARSAGGEGGGGGWCAGGGPRLILACFAALSAAITLALFTQIYYNDYEVVPHGGVSSDAELCSAAGTDALKRGGRALDAAAASALCLAVLAPHHTSLDASGSLVYWEYRQSRTQRPMLAEWGASPSPPGSAAARPPRLLAALADLHKDLGALPWHTVLQPAIDLAKSGFSISESLAAALAQAASEAGTAASGIPPPPPQGSLSSAPELAAYLESLQRNTSAELSAAWNSSGIVRRSAAAAGAAGAWRVFAGGAGAGPARRALALALDPPPLDPDDASRRVISALQQEAAGAEDAWPPAPGGVATGLAVVDSFDTYVALVTGLSSAFGSGPATAMGWTRDEPNPPRDLDLAPAILLDDRVCGTRYVMGGSTSAALAQAAAALASGGEVERARVSVARGGALAREWGVAGAGAGAGAGELPAGVLAPLNASAPYAAVNVVRQRADALLSHADSRGGGIASRF